jgi:hypothetical protein
MGRGIVAAQKSLLTRMGACQQIFARRLDAVLAVSNTTAIVTFTWVRLA